MGNVENLESRNVRRRDFLSLSAKLLAVSVAGHFTSGCGPAHKIGEKLGLCCDDDHGFYLPSENARFLNNGGAGFDESRLAQMLKDPEHKINDYDPDVIGFVNKVHLAVHGLPIPAHLNVEYAENIGGSGLLGRYLNGNLLILKGLSAKESIHTLLHEIGHDYDTVFWSETVAEFEAIRGDLEAIVAYPSLFKEAGFGLQKYAFEMNFNRTALEKYGLACFSSFLSIIKNNGALSNAHLAILREPVSDVDFKSLRTLNEDMDALYDLSRMVKEAAVSAWYGFAESVIRPDLRSDVVCGLSEKSLPKDGRLVLPAGMSYPQNYDYFLSMARACHSSE